MRHRRSRNLLVRDGPEAFPAPPPGCEAAPGTDDEPRATASGITPRRAAPRPLWLAVHLPLLPLEAFRATLPVELNGRPVALVAEHRLTHVDVVAAERGLRPGLKRATALALAGDVVLGEADPRREAAALRAVAHVALAFTPSVALEGGDADTAVRGGAGAACVLMEVRASLRLFGGQAGPDGLARLVARLREALAPLGHAVRIAAAPTALGAALLARHGAGAAGTAPDAAVAARLPGRAEFEARLDAVPVWLLGPGREHWEALQGMGLHVLADLRALPRSGLARRFGEALLDDLDRAFGRRADPRDWVALPEVFDSRLELYARAETADQVLAGAEVLLARLVAWAQARHGRIGAFTLAMRHEPRHGARVPATELRIELAEPALAPAHLQSLLRERLARVTLAAPTLELRLRCRHLVSGAPPNGELFPTRASEAEGLMRLVERLAARLGDAHVQRLVPVADHRPERASRPVPALSMPARTAVSPAQAAASTAVAAPTSRPAGSHEAATLPLHRPAFLLPEPVPLAAGADGQPQLDGRPLQLLSGPERIEAGWWDGDVAARDYFIAAEADGSLVWLWRGRLPTAEGQVQWFLQGRFA